MCKLRKSHLVKLLRSLNTKYIKTEDEYGKTVLKSVDGGSRIKTSAMGWVQKLTRQSAQQPNMGIQSVESGNTSTENSKDPEDSQRKSYTSAVNDDRTGHDNELVDSSRAIQGAETDAFLDTESGSIAGNHETHIEVTDECDSYFDKTLPYDYEVSLEDNKPEHNHGLPVTESDAAEIVHRFCEKKPMKWNGKSSNELMQVMKNSLHTLLKDALIVMANYFSLTMTQTDKTVNMNKIKKDELVKRLSDFLSIEVKMPKARIRLKQPKSLKDQAASCVMKNTYPKQSLNIAYATYVWPSRLKEWRQRNKVAEQITINGQDEE